MNDFIIQCIIAILGIVTVYLPNDMYIFKIVGIIMFNILVWRKQIQKLVSRRNK